MKNSTFLLGITAFCFGLLLAVASCTSKNEKATTTALDHNLYNLYLERDTIVPQLNVKRKVILNFFVTPINQFTLQGWVPKDNTDTTFGPKPQIKFKIGKISKDSLTIKPGTFLGNEVIHKSIVKAIINDKGKHRYLVLTPIDSAGHIIYKVILTINDPKVMEPEGDVYDELGIANPTPPRNY